MAKHTGPPESGADSPADPSADNPHSDLGQDRGQGFDDDVDPASVSPPARFGRLALWIASASALTVGVVATVAYGVWFDQDQRTYAKAMAAAHMKGRMVTPVRPFVRFCWSYRPLYCHSRESGNLIFPVLL